MFRPIPPISEVLPTVHWRLFLLLTGLSSIAIVWPDTISPSLPYTAAPTPKHLNESWHFSQEENNPYFFDLLITDLPKPEIKNSHKAYSEEPRTFRHTIKPGDSLSKIFSLHGFNHQEMYKIMAADQSLLALDILRPGHILTFHRGRDRQLQSMELFVHAGNRIVYQRENDGEFSYQELLNSGEWNRKILSGVITDNFYSAAKKSGLTDGDIATVHQLFRGRVNFSREILSGSRFQVVRSENYVKGEATGQSRIEGVRIFNGSQHLNAFLHTNGQYYNASGENLDGAFMRIPLSRKFHISDIFNPRRLHPVTGQVRPHNGTDFAAPTGTTVLAAAEGRVIRVENHPFAGRYIEIQHQGQYKTRYLHLHKTLVNAGQQVKRGQRIALSGASGRVTGAHLHYELHINNRPVNPITANIPLAEPIPNVNREDFLNQVAELVRQMDEETLLAQL